jgi:hypothetical protein
MSINIWKTINMNNQQDPPKDPRKKQPGIPDSKAANGRESSENALESSPTDSRLDEKVIVNEQRSNKIVNSPAQAATNDSESTGNDEEIVNR